MRKEPKMWGVVFVVGIAFGIRSVLCFLGKSDFSEGVKQAVLGKKVLADIGNEGFLLVCLLVALNLVLKMMYCVRGELLENNANLEKNGKGQSDWLFLISLSAFATGIVLIGGGVACAYSKMGNLVVGFMLAAGIVSEIAAIGFGFLYHRVIKQIAYMHGLANKREQLDRLMQIAAELDNKYEVLAEILETILEDSVGHM